MDKGDVEAQVKEGYESMKKFLNKKEGL